jgi:hypothetical protein
MPDEWYTGWCEYVRWVVGIGMLLIVLALIADRLGWLGA